MYAFDLTRPIYYFRRGVPDDSSLPAFDAAKFRPGYSPDVVKKGDSEYVVVVTGVKDTGLCG